MLDGIDVREELRVLHWHQLVNARNSIFPSADKFSEQGGKGAENSEHVKQGSKNAEHEEYCEKGSKEAENETNIKLDTSQDDVTVPDVDIEVPAPVNSARKRKHMSRGSIMYRRGSSVLGDDAFLPSCTNKNDEDQLLYSRKSVFELQNPDDFGTKWVVLERWKVLVLEWWDPITNMTLDQSTAHFQLLNTLTLTTADSLEVELASSLRVYELFWMYFFC